MKRKYGSNEEALAVAKEAMWLAWTAAGGPAGMGMFRHNPDANKEAVWGRQGLEPSYVNADYVFGRMLKLRFHIRGDTLDIPDDQPCFDYQGWCGKYLTYAALFDAAEKVVKHQKVAQSK